MVSLRRFALYFGMLLNNPAKQLGVTLNPSQKNYLRKGKESLDIACETLSAYQECVDLACVEGHADDTQSAIEKAALRDLWLESELLGGRMRALKSLTEKALAEEGLLWSPTFWQKLK